MSAFTNKIDFLAVVTVKNANPNGDPLNGNRPREDFNGYGEISDVCIKRKIRNRLQDMGEIIFVQSDNHDNYDGINVLKNRANNIKGLKNAENKETYREIACKTWLDVRAFGQVFAFDNLSVGVRGPISIHPAFSVDPIDISSIKITKCVSSDTKKTDDDSDIEGKGRDTMGDKHRVRFGVYLIKGSINTQPAKLTGFSNEDAEKIKLALSTLFENDASSARPDGSMEVKKLYWFKHSCPTGDYSAAKVHNSVKVKVKEGVEAPKCFEDYTIEYTPLENLDCEIIEGR